MTRCSLAVEPLVPPPIDTALAFSHDASCEHPAAVAGAKVENRFLVFQARQRVFCTGPLDARAPNQVRGLACAGHGAPRAALVVNDLRIGGVGTQHPVESYRQLAGRCHLGYSLGLAMATVLILLAQSFIAANRRLGRFHQQQAHETVALFADRAQALLATGTVFAWNQSQIAGHLLAPLKPVGIADGHHERQCGDRAYSRLRHQQPGLRVGKCCFLHRRLQWFDLLLQLGQ